MAQHRPSFSSAIHLLAQLVNPELDEPADVLREHVAMKVIAELWITHPARVASWVYNDRHPTMDPDTRAEWYAQLLGTSVRNPNVPEDEPTPTPKPRKSKHA